MCFSTDSSRKAGFYPVTIVNKPSLAQENIIYEQNLLSPKDRKHKQNARSCCTDTDWEANLGRDTQQNIQKYTQNDPAFVNTSNKSDGL